MAYLPPHLRKKQGASSEADSTSPRSLESLQEKTTKTSDPLYTSEELAFLLHCDKGDLSTLTVTRAENALIESSERNLDNDILRGIIVFDGEHPEWKTNHKILCKSNLHVLHKIARDREDQGDNLVIDGPPPETTRNDYPLFQQTPFMKDRFDFAGWWHIQNVDFLAPRSAELIALFDKKFNSQGRNGRSHSQSFAAQHSKPKTRSEQAWRESLNREWAVVDLVQNHTRKDRLEPAADVPPGAYTLLANDASRATSVSAQSPPFCVNTGQDTSCLSQNSTSLAASGAAGPSSTDASGDDHTSDAADPPTDPKSMSTGAIVGTIAGIVVGVGGLLFVLRHRVLRSRTLQRPGGPYMLF